MTTGARDAGLVDEVLAGASEAASVRQVVTDPLRYGAGERLEAEGISPRSVRMDLVRSKYKPGHKLSGDYVLTFADDATRPRPANLAWTVTPAGVATVLQLSPADDRLPQLQRLVDPRHVASLAGALTGRSVLAPESSDVRTVRYRPGQRHVLVTDLGRDVGRVYVKTDRDRSGAEAVAVARLMNEAFTRHHPAAAAAAPLGWVPEDSAALWWAAPGVSLSRVIAGGGERQPSAVAAMAAVAAVARALRVVHGLGDRLGTGMGTWTRRRDAPGEVHAVLSAAGHIDVLLPELGSVFSALLAEVAERLDRLPPEPPSSAHGDFKCDNILVHRQAPRILDLDRACQAEPALDLGKFLADLGWWVPDAGRRRPLEAAFREGYGPCHPLRWARAALWAVLFMLKNAARRAAVHAPDWESLVTCRAAAASQALAAAREAS